MRDLLLPHAPALLAKAVELALNGDIQALRLCIERLLPKAVPSPGLPEMGQLFQETSHLNIITSLYQSLQNYEISPQQAENALKFLTQLSQIKKDETEQELTEEQIKEKLLQELRKSGIILHKCGYIADVMVTEEEKQRLDPNLFYSNLTDKIE